LPSLLRDNLRCSRAVVCEVALYIPQSVAIITVPSRRPLDLWLQISQSEPNEKREE